MSPKGRSGSTQVWDQINLRFDEMKASIEGLKNAVDDNLQELKHGREENREALVQIRKDFDTYVAVQSQKEAEQKCWREKLENETLPGISARIDAGRAAWKDKLLYGSFAATIIVAVWEIVRTFVK